MKLLRFLSILMFVTIPGVASAHGIIFGQTADNETGWHWTGYLEIAVFVLAGAITIGVAVRSKMKEKKKA